MDEKRRLNGTSEPGTARKMEESKDPQDAPHEQSAGDGFREEEDQQIAQYGGGQQDQGYPEVQVE